MKIEQVYRPPTAQLLAGAFAAIVASVIFVVLIFVLPPFNLAPSDRNTRATIVFANGALMGVGLLVMALSVAKVMRHFRQVKVRPSCVTEWLALAVHCALIVALFIWSSYEVINAFATGVIATFSRHAGTVSKSEAQQYFWLSVLGWSLLSYLCVGGMIRVYRIVSRPNQSLNTDAGDKSARGS